MSNSKCCMLTIFATVSVASNYEDKKLIQSFQMTTCRAGGTSLVRYDTGHIYTKFQ